MTRKIKALGLAVFAVLAMGAFSAATASASEFHSEEVHTILSGFQHASEDEFTVNAGTVKCNEATYAGTIVNVTKNEKGEVIAEDPIKTTSTVTVTPTYTKCTAFGFVSTTIDTNGCGYTFHTGEGTENTAGTVTIECPAGNSIVVTAFNCEVTVGAQGPLGGITYTNKGAGAAREVTLDVNITGISYIQHSKSFPGCSANSTLPRTDGTYKGSGTVKGLNTTSNQLGIWVH